MISRDQHCRCCGAEASVATCEKPRSPKHTARYFVKLKLLFDNWPGHHSETGEVVDFKPADPTHLRKYLQVLAGYDNLTRVLVAAKNNADVMAARVIAEASVRAAGEYPFVSVVGQWIEVRCSKSIRYEQLSQKAFSELDAAVTSAAHRITGLDAEAMLQGYQNEQQEPEGRWSGG